MNSRRELAGLRSVPPDLRGMARRALGLGWTLHHCGSGHLAWCRPDGCKIYTGNDRAGGRAITNARAKLRRAGLGGK